jgi:quercetin dioxygenase-like cupin family protein
MEINMNKIEKIWGETSELLNINNVSINRLNITKNSKCSKHYHQHKYNVFYIENGSIFVHTWQDNKIISTLLNKGDSLVISPGIEHQFESVEDSIVYEIYYTSLDNNDIIRQ